MLNYQYLGHVAVNRMLDLSGRNLSQTPPAPVAAPAPPASAMTTNGVLAVIGVALLSGWIGYAVGSRWPSKVLQRGY